MKQAMRRILLFLLAAAVMLCSFPAVSYAARTYVPETIEITYSFNSGEAESGLLPTDKVTWRDDCFLRSSYLGCCHLAEVSAAAALASSPYINSSLTPTQNEPLAPRYVTEFLSKAHFQDVETNKYYTTRSEENSAAAAFGHKIIQDGKKTYTLLAIVIRSSNYTQEWTGNFTISSEDGTTGNMHAGFKAARDEILRCAAQYMKKHHITGYLKVWIAGHSRGAATSNSLGGFFAGGGQEYFRAMGVPVTITPDNVYCYTFSTPRPIRPGLTHLEDLSVAGNRPNYPNDTPGKAYVSRNTGAVDPGAACYTGIRNYPKYHDVVPKLPPSIPGWDFTYYGQVCEYDSSDLPGGPVSEAEMLQQLKAFDSQMYKTFTNGGSPEDYQRVTLDFDKLMEKICSGEQFVIADVMKPTDKGPSGMGDLMQSRVNSLELIASSPRVFFENDFQHAAQALAGLFGMVSLDMNDPKLNLEDLIKAAVFWVLDFGVTRLKSAQNNALNRASNDGESAAVVRFLEQLLSYLFPNESIPAGSLCLVQILEIAARYVFPQSGNTKVSEKVLDLIVPLLPDPGSSVEADMIYDYLNTYIPGAPSSYTKAQKIETFLKACGWGPEKGSEAWDNGETATTTSRNLCYVAAIAAAFLDYPSWLVNALADPNNPATFPDQVREVLQFLMPEGETYQNLTTAADLMGRRGADSLYSGPLNSLAQKGYSQGYIEDACRHFSDLKKYIRPLRTVLLTFLFSTKGETLSVEGMVRNLSLFLANDGLIAPSHYVQVDLAWAKARRAKGIWDHTPTPTPTSKPVPVTGDTSLPLLWIGFVLLGLFGLVFCVGLKKTTRKK